LNQSPLLGICPKVAVAGDYLQWTFLNAGFLIWTKSKREFIEMNNPVKAELVGRPEDYLYSSAHDYSGEKGLVEIRFV
jgi:hypothetical protein